MTMRVNVNLSLDMETAKKLEKKREQDPEFSISHFVAEKIQDNLEVEDD